MARRSAPDWAVAWLGVLGLLALLGLLTPMHARADGDPASDVLLGENVFYPYTPPVTAALQGSLNAQASAAHRAGFPIKVALIASPTDLGVIPSLFGKPQTYADFLDREISFEGPQPLLVVMAAGYGVQGTKPSVALAVKGLPKPGGRTSDDLAQAAIAAIPRLASAAGHGISGGGRAPATKSGDGGGSNTIIVLALAIAAILVAGALIALRRRPAPSAGRRSQRRRSRRRRSQRRRA